MQTARDLIFTYMKNREEFYCVLLPRVPHEAQRARLTEAVQPISPDEGELASLKDLPEEDPDDFLAGLSLNDALKKPAFGSTWGRTTISIEEALLRSQSIEKTGAVLFEHLAGLYPSSVSLFLQWLQERKAVLVELLRFDDELRYHRFSP